MEQRRMSINFYVGYLVTLLAIVYGVELYLGTLYARYVIVFTGAIFLAGLIVGQRNERAWMAQRYRGESAQCSRQESRRSPMWVAGSGKRGACS